MGSIPPETIEQIAAANDVVEVIGSYFPLKRAGANYKALCPFHQEKTPSFTVSPSRQTFHCFGCGVGGSVFRFVMEYEHVDFPAAVRRLAGRVGIPVIEQGGAAGGDRQQETRHILLQLHAEAAEWFHITLLSKAGEAAREYLKKRGIDKRIAVDWQLGFAPDEWQALSDWAKQRGYSQQVLLQSGLITQKEDNAEHRTYDRFRGRIMFPICNDIGEVIGFSGRVLNGDAQAAKYVNSPETPLFRKGKILFGLHKTKRDLIETKSAIICEGQLDLITVFEAGIRNVVAPQGTAFTEQQARVLKRYVTDVVLCFDADAAGQKAAERSLDALLETDVIVRVAEMPPGEDPDSLIRRGGRDEFEQRIANARNFFDVWLDRETASVDLDALGPKMQLARRLAETLGRVRDPVMRGEVATRVSARIGVPPRDFQRLVSTPQRFVAADEPEEQRQQSLPAPRHDIEMLCVLALRDREARDLLLSQNWRDVLSQTPDAEMLVRILEAEIDPDNPASANAFMAQLPAAEEGLVSRWLVERVPPNGLAVARGWWGGLQQAVLRRQLQIAEGRMKLPRLSTGEEVVLQKQIVDLRKQLDELSALSSARVLDS
jgi:DNA primase